MSADAISRWRIVSWRSSGQGVCLWLLEMEKEDACCSGHAGSGRRDGQPCTVENSESPNHGASSCQG